MNAQQVAFARDHREDLLERRARDVVACLIAGEPVLLIGSPGSGACRVARRASELLLAQVDSGDYSWTERAWIYAGAGMAEPCIDEEGRTGLPFRAPHYTVSPAGLFGGPCIGPTRPGEVNLAHGGVLYLDEVDSFRRTAIRDLALVHAKGSTERWDRRTGQTFQIPARFGLVASCDESLAAALRVCSLGIAWTVVSL